MRKMKILTLLLCASLAFAYMGCSNSSGGSDSGTPAGAGGSETGGGQQDGSLPTGDFTQTGYHDLGSPVIINGTRYDIVTFGNYPQSLKDNSVTVSSTATNVNGFICYEGSDNEWYVKHGESGNEMYFKVEPIKWRVLTTNYDHDGNASTPGKKLLLAEKILINKAYHASSNNYETSSIRAYLTGDFFTTAFTQAEQDAIATTTVVNNARSTNPDGNASEWNNGANQYAGDPTEDKIFLLSEQEVTKTDYGFAAYNEYKGDGTHNDSTRIRMPTAFAQANGALRNNREGYGGYWWLRSPLYFDSSYVLNVYNNGMADTQGDVDNDFRGVVPALCLN